MNNFTYYLYYKPRDIYRTIRHWLYCNLNKEHWALLKAAFTSYGWDGCFLNYLEEKQIDKQLKWFSNHQTMIDSQYHEIMWSLRIAKHCIHIINNETDLYHYDGQVGNISLGNGLFQSDTSKLLYHYDGPRVNTRNYRRFTNFRDQASADMFPDQVYIAKAKHIYHMIREKYTDYWWD